MSTFPLEPQIRKRGTGKEWNVGDKRLIKDSQVESHMCERETEKEGGRERNEESYLWLWPETAVSLRCVEDGSLLISSPSCHSIYVASLLSSEGQIPTSSLERERESIQLSNQSLWWRILLYKRMASCKCLLLLLFAKTLTETGGAFSDDVAPSRWNRGSSDAVLTLQIWHWAESLPWAWF